MITDFDKFYEGRLWDLLDSEKPVEDESGYIPIPLKSLSIYNGSLYSRDLLNFFQKNIVGEKITVLAQKIDNSYDRYHRNDKYTFRLKKIRLIDRGIYYYLLYDDENTYKLNAHELLDCLVYAKDTRKYNVNDLFGEEVWESNSEDDKVKDNQIREFSYPIIQDLDEYYISKYGYLPISNDLMVNLYVEYFKKNLIGKKVTMKLPKHITFILKDISTNFVDITVKSEDGRVFQIDCDAQLLSSTLVWKEKKFTEEDPYGEEDWENDYIKEHIELDPFGEEEWEDYKPNLNPLPKKVRYIGLNGVLFCVGDVFNVVGVRGDQRRAIEEFGIDDYLPIECVYTVYLSDGKSNFVFEIKTFLKIFESAD